ncbi:Threonine synthase [Buchnera aphidicola (Anoecia corni)]|uniref:Threonine synthase n=1 Tax=Buchnera aphidicola (Anoecia corni) TaxID=2994477 RepID=A0AAT9IHZ0_9GAMM
MKLYNLKDATEIVTFSQAVQLGLGNNQGLFFPKKLPTIKTSDLEKVLDMDFIYRSTFVLSMFIGNEIPFNELEKIVKKSFSFSSPKIRILNQSISCFELFHGPTLAFKDFGARFMAQTLSYLNKKNNKRITVLTATSGDTGAAVAHAFYLMDNVKVVILYPKGKISVLQEKLFCTLGNNIQTISINGSFDDCQDLVKQAFNDSHLRKYYGLNSANSINISRILAQICYYFEAFSQLSKKNRRELIISVPCGNFGNLTAGLLAKSLGLPIKSFIAATNANDTVPRFLLNKKWKPRKTISTISNAMDISQPNNWPRVEEIFRRKKWSIKSLGFGSVSDIETKKKIKELYSLNYTSEPHAAVAYKLLKEKIKEQEYGVFLGTAHPAKFKDVVDEVLNISLSLPKELASREKSILLSKNINPDFVLLKEILLNQ